MLEVMLRHQTSPTWQVVTHGSELLPTTAILPQQLEAQVVIVHPVMVVDPWGLRHGDLGVLVIVTASHTCMFAALPLQRGACSPLVGPAFVCTVWRVVCTGQARATVLSPACCVPRALPVPVSAAGPG